MVIQSEDEIISEDDEGKKTKQSRSFICKGKSTLKVSAEVALIYTTTSNLGVNLSQLKKKSSWFICHQLCSSSLGGSISLEVQLFSCQSTSALQQWLPWSSIPNLFILRNPGQNILPPILWHITTSAGSPYKDGKNVPNFF